MCLPSPHFSFALMPPSNFQTFYAMDLHVCGVSWGWGLCLGLNPQLPLSELSQPLCFKTTIKVLFDKHSVP